MRCLWMLSLAMLLAPQLGASHTLNDRQNSIIKGWLNAHNGYRQANEADCECKDDIQAIRRGYGGRWKSVPDYNPYVVTGDFNGDGHADFAVVVVDTTKQTERFTLLVFNGPSNSARQSPAYVEVDLEMKGIGMFFGPPRPKPYRLVVGRFESEGYVLEPEGKTYHRVTYKE